MKRLFCRSTYLSWISTLFLFLSLAVVPAAAQPGAGAGAGGGEAAAGGEGGGCGGGGGGEGGEGEGGAEGGNQAANSAKGIEQQANNNANAIRAGEVPAEGFSTQATAELVALKEEAEAAGDTEALEAVASAEEAVRNFTVLNATEANENSIRAPQDSVSLEVAGVLAGSPEEGSLDNLSAGDKLLSSLGEEESTLSSLEFTPALVVGSSQLAPQTTLPVEPVENEGLVEAPVFPNLLANDGVSGRSPANRGYGQGHRP